MHVQNYDFCLYKCQPLPLPRKDIAITKFSLLDTIQVLDLFGKYIMAALKIYLSYKKESCISFTNPIILYIYMYVIIVYYEYIIRVYWYREFIYKYKPLVCVVAIIVSCRYLYYIFKSDFMPYKQSFMIASVI